MRVHAWRAIRPLIKRGGARRGACAFALGLALTIGACASKNPSVYQSTDSRNEIKKVIWAHHREVKECYEKSSEKKPLPEGKIVFRWSFDDTGKVVDVGTKRSDPGLEPAAECAKERMKEWRFPAAAKGDCVEVAYPFAFRN